MNYRLEVRFGEGGYFYYQVIKQFNESDDICYLCNSVEEAIEKLKELLGVFIRDKNG